MSINFTGTLYKGGEWADEYLQAQPWSSGPVAFIGLKIFAKDRLLIRDFAWDKDEINNC